MIERLIPAIQLQLQSGAIACRFDGQDCLYRDFDGRRVVADVEGSCSFRVTGHVDCFVNGVLASSCSGCFDGWLRVVAQGEGVVETQVDTEKWSISAREPILKFRVDQVGPKFQNRSAIQTLDSKFENGEDHSGPVASFLNRLEFRLELRGPVVLARTYDRFHGRQRCRVLVDGAERAIWFSPSENRVNRWHWDIVVISPGVTGPCSLVIDPSAGYPLWSLSELLILPVQKLP